MKYYDKRRERSGDYMDYGLALSLRSPISNATNAAKAAGFKIVHIVLVHHAGATMLYLLYLSS